MSVVGRLYRSLSAMLRRRHLAREMSAEWQFHIDQHAAALQQQGLSEAEARHAAMVAFGSQSQWRERTWEVLDVLWLDELRRDLTYAVRALWKDRGFTITVCVTLAICFGAYTAAFTVVDRAALRPLHVPQADRLVTIFNNYPLAGSTHTGATAPDYFERGVAATAFESQALLRSRHVSATIGNDARRLVAMHVTPSFFDVLRVYPQNGRAFARNEQEEGAAPVAIVSDVLRKQLFPAGDALGRVLRIDGEPFTIVGVMPAEFSFFEPGVQVWTPLVISERQKAQRYSNDYRYVARLVPGVSVAQAQAQIERLNTESLERHPETKPVLASTGFYTTVVSLEQDLVRDVRSSIYLLWMGAAAVLMIGCLNVGNLVLARSWARRSDTSTRLALGAPRFRIVRQFITEQLLITLTSAAGGLLLGRVLLAWFGTALQDFAPWADVAIDTRVTAILLMTAMPAAILLGLMPLLGGSLYSQMRTDQMRVAAQNRRFRTVRRVLAATQVGAAFVLVVGSLLLLASFRHVLEIDPGFDPDQVLTASISLPASRYSTEATVGFMREALRQLQSVPGIVSVGATTSPPFDRAFTQDVMLPEDYQLTPGTSLTAAYHSVITPGYLEALGVHPVAGRTFDEHDTADATHVVIVDERLARRYWPDGQAVGRRMYAPSNPQDITVITPSTRWFTVVGVVPEIKLRGLVEGAGVTGAFYTVYTQLPRRDFTFAVRSPGDSAAAVRTVIARLDPEVAVFDVQTLTRRTERSVSGRRLTMNLAMVFSVVALVLCVVGVYGVLAYLVAQRRRELAIRSALGGSPAELAKLVLREGVVLCAIGLTIGGAASMLLGRLLQHELFGTAAIEPAMLTGVAALVIVAGLAACAAPARRASHTSPAAILGE